MSYNYIEYLKTAITILRHCFLRGPCKMVIKKNSVEKSILQSSFETPACQDMSFGVEELNSVESSELAVAE
jgi:hypothetical protein